MPNPLGGKPKRELLQNTGNGNGEEKKASAPEAEEVKPVVEEPIVAASPPPQEGQLLLQVPTEPLMLIEEPVREEEERPSHGVLTPSTQMPLPKGPAVLRRTYRNANFRDFYVPRTLQVDKRIAEMFDDLLNRSGHNKTQAANRIIMYVLLNSGYQIKPDVLADPVYKLEEDL